MHSSWVASRSINSSREEERAGERGGLCSFPPFCTQKLTQDHFLTRLLRAGVPLCDFAVKHWHKTNEELVSPV